MTTQSLQKLDDRVKSMIGKTFLVNAVSHKVLSHKIENDKLTIVTDKKWFPAVDVQHSSKLLEQFLETDDEPEVLPAQPMQPAVLQASVDLKNILLDNIKRVQENKEYIPQASEIGSQVKTLIDLAKTEIEFYKMTKR